MRKNLFFLFAFSVPTSYLFAQESATTLAMKPEKLYITGNAAYDRGQEEKSVLEMIADGDKFVYNGLLEPGTCKFEDEKQ